MNILITGIHGFVGSNLTKALCGNHVLYGLDIVAPEKDGVVRTFSWKDLDEDKLPCMDTIIHLAGKAHDTKNTANPQSYFDVNYELTKNIFDRFLSSDAKTFIFFSSVKAAADTVSGDILQESDPTNPQTPYGQSKLQAEEYILTEMAKKNDDIDQEKRVYLLRPCMIHGPGNKGNLNLLYNVVSKGVPYPLGAFDNRRSFTSIDNLCFVLEQLISGKAASGIYQIADDDPLSTNELIALISATINQPKRIWYIKTSLISRLAKVGDVLHLPLNSERLKKLTESYVVSNVKLKRALNISNMPISAQEGLKKTVESFISRNS